MNTTAIISGLTAFCIGAGGVLAGAATAGKLNSSSIVIAVVFGATAAAKDLRSLFKLPPVSGDSGPNAPVALLLATLGLGALLVGLTGCASVQPGADPLVVRAEQSETTGKATFDLVLNVDNADRGFWRTNAPAFHNFCEWLRTPVTIDITNSLPRASAMLWNVDEAKVSYQLRGGSSNALWSAVSAAETVIGQAGSWSTIVTNRAQ